MRYHQLALANAMAHLIRFAVAPNSSGDVCLVHCLMFLGKMFVFGWTLVLLQSCLVESATVPGILLFS